MSRFIFHLDFDSYFASVEQQCNPFLRNRPIGVSRKPQDVTVVAAASKEAKLWGVRSGMPSWEARRLCPQIELVAGDPAKYLYATDRALALLKRYTPLIEPYSIDEAFLDLTDAVRFRFNGDTQALARQIKGELGRWITCSIGIAPSKVLAKLCCEQHKPDGIAQITPEQVPQVLERTRATEIAGIAQGLGRRLYRLGIITLAELGRSSIEKLKREFGVVGYALHAIGQGRDPAPLNPHLRFEPPKSFSHSRVISYEFGARSWGRVQPILYFLCYKIARRLRAQGYAGRVVRLLACEAVGVDDGEAQAVHKQYTLVLPTADERVILNTCGRIARLAGGIAWPIRVIGVAVEGLVRREALPLSLFEYDRRRARLLGALDRLNDEWGEFTVADGDRKSTRLNSSHIPLSRMPSSA